MNLLKFTNGGTYYPVFLVLTPAQQFLGGGVNVTLPEPTLEKQVCLCIIISILINLNLYLILTFMFYTFMLYKADANTAASWQARQC